MRELKNAASEEGVARLMDNASMSIVITDPTLPDNPITYVNDAFEKLTLYSRDFAVGRSCRFLQGKDTDPGAVERIREGLKGREEFEVVLRNYKADGTPFLNQLLICPITDEAGEVRAFLGAQRKVDPSYSQGDEAMRALARADSSLTILRELQHRVKNHLAMIVSMIRMQAKREVTAGSLQALGRRIEALSLLYEELFSANIRFGSRQEIAGGAYLSRIVNVIAGLENRSAVHVHVDCDDIALQVDTAARLGLLLSELLTNALEHAFGDRESGTVWVRLSKLSDERFHLVVRDDGVGLPPGSNWPHGAQSLHDQKRRAKTGDGKLETTGQDGRSGVGGSIVAALTQSLDAELTVESSPEGTEVTVDMPLFA